MTEFTELDINELENALKISKETDLNGHIPTALLLNDKKQSDLPRVHVEGDNEFVCRLCGKELNAESSAKSKAVEESQDDGICKICSSRRDSSSDCPVFDEDADVPNKRDSGFHTLKREESSKIEPEQTESALSSASSADSAVSVEFCGPAASTGSESNIPGILIDSHIDKNESAIKQENSRKADETSFKETPRTLGDKLFHYKGYTRTEVAKHISKNTDFSKQTGKEYLKFFNFSNQSLIDSYREFLGKFALLGETQERERILCYFSERYIACNLDFLDSNPDSVHTLVCALTLLNTDLHANMSFSGGRKKMTNKQFVTNLSGLMSDKSDYPKDLLLSLYSSVKKTPLPWGGKEQRKLPRSSSVRHNNGNDEGRLPTKIVNRSRSVRTPVKSSINMFDDGKQGNSSRVGTGRSAKMRSLSTNHGLLWRKVLFDSDGKKVSLGKRGWKIHSVALKNLELHAVKRGTSEAKRISLHHSWAEESANDSKRDHVFRLTLADSSVTLYQAGSEKECRKWVKDINKAAALLSAAPLCSPVGSQLIFRKALLPSAPSTLPLNNQLEKMQELLSEHQTDLENTEKSFKTEKLTSQYIQYYDDKTAHLKSEIKKYKHYIKILQVLAHTRLGTPDKSGSNLEMSRESSESGSLISITPSEPPLASPSPFHIPDNFNHIESGGMDPPNFSYPTGGLSSPPHLVSAQHRHLSLSPTSSLPNLSPILEGAALPTTGPATSSNPSYGSLMRQRKDKNLYESTINDASHHSCHDDTTDSQVRVKLGNVNDSNHVAMAIRTYRKHHPVLMTPENQQINSNQDQSLVNLPSNSTTERKFSPVPETSPVPDHQSVSNVCFPVERYEMRIADMEMQSDQSTVHCQSNVSMPSRVRHNAFKPELNVDGKVYFNNSTLTRIRGRREKKGTERYSYMQAVSFPDP